jgi:hypothetical protein
VAFSLSTEILFCRSRFFLDPPNALYRLNRRSFYALTFVSFALHTLGLVLFGT